jgi:large subunit ribosomal protein L13
MKTTQFVRKEDKGEKWYLLDANGIPAGRVASMAAVVLRGKHRPDFTPNIDMGDHVIIINAEKVVLTGRKLEQKTYFRHSGYPGGWTMTKAKKMLNEKPERILQFAVRGMLPKNFLRDKLMTKLRIFKGPDHPHVAQKPNSIKISEMKFIEAVTK